MPGLNEINVAWRYSMSFRPAGSGCFASQWAHLRSHPLSHLPRIHEADVADVFAAFDIDRDNIISQKDMASIMKQDNEAITLKCVRCEIERARNSHVLN